MIQELHDLSNFDNLPPEKARFVLAETKLKLQNIMTHLEMLELKLAHNNKRLQTQQESLVHANPAHK